MSDKEPDTEKTPQWNWAPGHPFVVTWPTLNDIEEAIVADAAMELKYKNNGAIGPQICTKCKFKNDYAGKEHLSPDGSYTCRSCK